MKVLNRINIAAFGGEYLGTAFLVMMFLILTQTTAVSYFIATSVGIAMALVYMVFASVSGGHANPAVTFGFWTARQISSARAVAYIIAQGLGALSAWGIFTYLHNMTLQRVATSFDWRVFIAEAIGAGIFSMAFAAVVLSKRDVFHSAFAIGAAIFVGVMIASIAARGYINPAVALGLSRYHFDWAYILGPLAGGLVGVNLYNELFTTSKGWLATATKARK